MGYKGEPDSAMGSLLDRLFQALSAKGIAVKRGRGGAWLARCPAHDDKTPSLSIKVSDGRILVHCFAGCSPENIVSSLDMNMHDLFVDNATINVQNSGKKVPGKTPPITLESLAREKRFPLNWLYTFGVSLAENGRGLLFPYFQEDGTTARTRIRLAVHKDALYDHRFSWKSNADEASRPISVYGAHLLRRFTARETLLLVEGETDVIAVTEGAWLPVLGLPGASMAEKLQPSHVAGFASVVIVREPDAGGRAFVSGLLARLRALDYKGHIRIAHMPSGIKDSAALWAAVADEHGGWDALGVPETLETCRAAFRGRMLAAMEEAGEPPTAPDEPSDAVRWIMTRLSDAERSSIVWLWSKYIAVGKLLHCLFGLGGVGKTLIILHLIAILTTGRKWPDKSGNAAVAAAAFLTAEDGINDTVLPRLLAARGDTSLVWILDDVYEVGGQKRFFNLSEADSIEHLKGRLRSIPNLKLLVIDPITAFLGRADTHKIGDVRAALFPLTRLAEELGIAVVYVHHFNKAQGQSAMHRASGSTAFIDAVRVAIMACDNPDAPNGRWVMKVVKSNIGKKPPGIGYVIHAAPEFDAARIEWEDEPVEKSEAELLAPADFSVPAQATGAELFLRDMLGDGVRPANEVSEEAKSAGFTEKEIRTARERLGVIVNRKGFGKNGRWLWMLPGDRRCAIDAIDAQLLDGASMGSYDGDDLFDKAERRALP